MLSPAAASISSSASTKGRPSRFASRRPTVDLPAPIIPISAIDFSGREGAAAMFGAIQSAPGWGKRPAMPRTSFAPTRRRRSPVPTIFAIIVVLFLALLVYAWAKNKDVAPTRIEQDVTNELAH